MNGPNWDGTATRALSPEPGTVSDMSTHRGVPKPPPEIWAALENAGGFHTDRYRIAHAAYVAWLRDVHGIIEGVQGNTAPEEAWG